MMLQTLLDRAKNTLFLRGWSLFNVPLINIIGPRVQELTDESCSVLVPLNYLTRNHARSLYISAQVTGAELCAGLLAVHHSRKKGKKVVLIFKDLHAVFKKRPDADTVFTCVEGKEVKALVAQALLSGQRVNKTLTAIATCPKKWGQEPVAEFQLTISIKRK